MKVNRLKVIALVELKRVWNDRRFLFLLVVAPIISCIVFGFVAFRNPEAIDTTIFVDSNQQVTIDRQIQQIIDEISYYEREDGSQPFSVTMELNSRGEAIQRLDEGNTRAVVILEQGEDGLEGVEVIVDVTETVVTNEFTLELPKILNKYSKNISTKLLTELLSEQKEVSREAVTEKAKQIISPLDTTFKTNAWRELRYFDFYASAMIIILTMSLPLSLSLISITSERSSGTIERIFASPYKRSEIITGKMLAHSIFAILFAVLIIATLKAVFDIALGSIGLVLLIATLVGINGVILGLLISSITHTEAESVVVGIMCVFAIMGLMTYIVPWETMHPLAKYVSSVIPYTYGIQAVRGVNMVGLGFSDVWPNLVILFGSILVQTLIAIPILRREII